MLGASRTSLVESGRGRLAGWMVAGLALVISACSGPQDAQSQNDESPNSTSSHQETAAEHASADPAAVTPSGAEWRQHGGRADEQRFSPLSQINTANASELGLAWEFDDFVVRGRTHRGMQASPIVADGVMYVTGPWSVVYALDAVTGQLRWEFDPEVEGGWARKACCDAVNRGVALWNDLVIVGTLDGYLVAVDAETGEERWRAQTFIDRARPYTITGAPRLAGDLVVIGNGGAELGVRGYVTAYHAATGELAWRFFTVPGAGPDEHPEIAAARETWSADTRYDIGGGGTVWDSMTYDAELGLLYVGVGNGSPWPSWTRSPGGGDNLYLSSILALEAATGRLRWHYQTTPSDNWDYTATQNIILADLVIDGAARKVLMQAPKNGFFYVLDRETGELVSAEAYTRVTWADGVDMQTGRPRVSPSALYQDGPRVIWPSTAGGHNWQPMAHSPQTGLAYIPVLELAMRFDDGPVGERVPDAMNIGASARPPFSPADAPLLGGEPPARPSGVLRAWDPVTQTETWRAAGAYWSGGVLATAGDLVVQGATDGAFVVYHAVTGEVLTRIETGTAIMGPPVSYEVDGVQYIAVVAGWGGAQLARYFPGTAPFARENNERLMVFKLGGGDVAPPPLRQPATLQPLFEGLADDDATLEHGRATFAIHCARCHAMGGAPNGYPNLWNMSRGVHESFDQIVLDGLMSYAGMAAFNDVLLADDVAAVHAFIASDQARRRAEADDSVAPIAGAH